MWRIRLHEWHHYFQYACCGGFSLFGHRLVRIRLAAALEVLNAYHAKHGTLKSMTRLVAEHIYGQDGRRPADFTLDDRAWASLISWNSAEELIGGLVSKDSFPFEYFAHHWNVVFGLWNVRLLEEGRLEAPPLVEGRSKDERLPYLSGEDVLEGGALREEVRFSIHYLGADAAAKLFAETRGPVYWPVADLMWRALRARPTDPLFGVLCELALAQFPDPELVPNAAEIPWGVVHPGRFLARAIVKLSQERVPSLKRAIDAYDYVAERLLSSDDRYHQLLERAGRLDPVDDVLVRRRDLITDSDELDLDRVRAAIEYPLMTIQASLKLRAEDPSVFMYDRQEQDDDARRQSRLLVMPPIVVSPTEVETYPNISGDALDHLLLLMGCVCHTIVEEVAQRGTVERAKRLMRTICAHYDDSYAGLLANYTPILLGNGVHAYAKERGVFDPAT
jgi:hypothetical protein